MSILRRRWAQGHQVDLTMPKPHAADCASVGWCWWNQKPCTVPAPSMSLSAWLSLVISIMFIMILFSLNAHIVNRIILNISAFPISSITIAMIVIIIIGMKITRTAIQSKRWWTISDSCTHSTIGTTFAYTITPSRCLAVAPVSIETVGIDVAASVTRP